MIQELNLSPVGYIVLVILLLWIGYKIAKTPSKKTVIKEPKPKEEASTYLSRYGAVIQQQGKI